MGNFEIPSELKHHATEVQEKSMELDILKWEIIGIDNILGIIESMSPEETKKVYLEYIRFDEEEAEKFAAMHIIDADPNDTEGIISYFEEELERKKEERDEVLAQTN